jgi:hypothetical protein
MTCGKGTESGDLVCPPASHPRAIRPNAVGAGKVDFSGGISQEPVPANFRMADKPPRAPVLCGRTSHSLQRILDGSSFGIHSDSDDSNFAAGSPDKPFYVVWVACENCSFLPEGCRHHNGVHDIRRFGHA